MIVKKKVQGPRIFWNGRWFNSLISPVTYSRGEIYLRWTMFEGEKLESGRQIVQMFDVPEGDSEGAIWRLREIALTICQKNYPRSWPNEY